MNILMSIVASAFVSATINTNMEEVASLQYTPSSVQSGDVVQIGDFQFVILSKSDFERMRLSIDNLTQNFKFMNSTESGRSALHGRRKSTSVTNGLITVTYEDGYNHVESARQNSVGRTARVPAAKTPKVMTEFERRRAEIFARRKSSASTTNEVSVTIRR